MEWSTCQGVRLLSLEVCKQGGDGYDQEAARQGTLQQWLPSLAMHQNHLWSFVKSTWHGTPLLCNLDNCTLNFLTRDLICDQIWEPLL